MAQISWPAFRNAAYKQVDAEGMNKALAKLRGYSFQFIVTRDPYFGETLENKCFVAESDVILEVGYRWAGRNTILWCWLDDGRKDEVAIPGKDAYCVMAKYYKPPQMPDEWCSKLKEDGSQNPEYLTSSPILYVNPAFDGKTVEGAVCYDMNNAYGWALEQPIPDTSAMERARAVKEGEIGFLIDADEAAAGWGRKLVMAKPGTFAEFVFKEMPSPYLKFVQRWFRERLFSEDPKVKGKAKAVINESIGYLQFKNPFIRACVVERTSARIRSFMDADTIYSNTDCICSARERPDLPVSDALGDFKVEHRGTVSVKGYNYQWNKGLPTYRGIPKSAFRRFQEKEGRPFDLLSDEAPDKDSGKIYTYSIEERTLIKCS